MSYEITSTAFRNYIRIRITGTWPSEEPEEGIKRIYDCWAVQRGGGLLIDTRELQGQATVTTNYYTAATFERIGFGEISRIAVMDNLVQQDVNDFFETVAHNRGLRFRFFYQAEQAAIDWLEEVI